MKDRLCDTQTDEFTGSRFKLWHTKDVQNAVALSIYISPAYDNFYLIARSIYADKC